MKKKLLPILLFTFFASYSQNSKLIALTIPSELKNGANVVIRNSITEVFLEDIDKMRVKTKRTITVLNKVGDNLVDTYAGYDNDTKINSLSAKIYNALGKEIKKFSKSKFIDVNAVDGGTLYSDSRVKYINYTPTSYPYTIVFESEYTNSSTAFIPEWDPIQSFYVATENSEYKVYNSKSLELNSKEFNFKGYSIKKIENSKATIHYKINNVSAIGYEKNSIPLYSYTPSVKVRSNKFAVKGITGVAKNWDELAVWEYNKLYKESDVISDKTKSEIEKLVKNANSPMDKAKLIYEFVQNKTRYINVSIGIGGLKPIESKIVDQVGYGDCKGLTNYTRALLKHVGITSYFTELYAGNTKRNMDIDFATIHGNHVILYIPNNEKDIWLECTNQTMPFGFLGDFTDDRNVLVVTPEGGVIKRTPAYLNETNLQTTKAEIILDNEGNLSANLEVSSEGIQYNNKFYIENKTNKDLKKYYKSNVWGYNNNLELNTIELINDKENIIFKEKLNVSIQDYASINQNELLFRVNVFNRNNYIPQRYRNRKLPLKIIRGYKDIDEYTIKLPKEYLLGKLPEKKVLKTKFGEYNLTLKRLDESNILYKKTILIKEGLYPKEDYKLYRDFMKKIARLENLRIALTKK